MDIQGVSKIDLDIQGGFDFEKWDILHMGRVRTISGKAHFILFNIFFFFCSGSHNIAANTREPIAVDAFREYIQSLKDDEYGSLMDEFKVLKN